MTFQAPPPDTNRGDGQGFANYITWHAQGSAPNNIPPASFSIRASGANQPKMPCPELGTGVVWDIDAIETGWLHWPQGGQKEYRPNPSVSQPLPYPGAGFSENIKIPMAIDQQRIACWDQASVGSWKGFCQISAMIAQQAPQNSGMLPVIVFTGSTLTATGNNSTQVPNFNIVQWVQRPAILMPQAQQPAPAPAQPAAPAPAPAPAQPAQPAQPQAPAAPAAPAGAWN